MNGTGIHNVNKRVSTSYIKICRQAKIRYANGAWSDCIVNCLIGKTLTVRRDLASRLTEWIKHKKICIIVENKYGRCCIL